MRMALIRLTQKVLIFIWHFINYINLKIEGVVFKKISITGILKVRNSGVLKIGDNFRAHSGNKLDYPIGSESFVLFNVHEKGKLVIKDNVGITNSTIDCYNKIEIGNNVLIGAGCYIFDTDYHSMHPIIRTKGIRSLVITRPIKIKDYAFIGGSCLITKGVTIGKNAIIGAGSVVLDDVPDNEIWAGNPAKCIKKMKNLK
jgi:acetyltransferase-like isoleucine patch superfamily enzyme